MDDPIVLGQAEAHEKLTARVFWQRVGESGFNDAGNVKEYANATTRSLVTRARAADGGRHVNDEQADVNHEAYTFLLDERDAAHEALLHAGTQQDDQIQAHGEASTASLSDVQKGKWYPIGAYGIANVAVSASGSGILEEGTDYELDTENGRIHIKRDADLSNGESLTLTFDQPRLEFEKFESQGQLLCNCNIIVEEYNQHSGFFLRRFAATGYLNVTEFPNQTGEFASYRVKFTPSAPITILKRATATAVETAPEVDEPAGQSSSSSSSTSATSSQSSSSQSS
jgi:hypothetical protein